jgi:predicted nucleic acid-binding protein
MMVLVDTSVWIDHFRRGDLRLAGFLDRGNAVMHPFVLGELTLGHLSGIAEVIDDLRRLPKAAVANTDEVLEFIVDRKLPGSGIGYVDVHLLAAAALVPETLVWTRDRRLLAAAQPLSLAAEFREGR